MNKQIVVIDSVITASLVVLALVVNKSHPISNSFSFLEGTYFMTIFLFWPYKRTVMWGHGHWPKPWWVLK